MSRAMLDIYYALGLLGETLDDLEAVRIATENRLRALTHPEQNIGLPDGHPFILDAKKLLSELEAMETATTKQLEATFADTPVAEWVEGQAGLGAKSIGRLLAVIGHPRMRLDPETGEVIPRQVGQLWTYCGHGDAERQKRRKGEQGNWNPKAKKRANQLVVACIKQKDKSPYYSLYVEIKERTKAEGRVHKAKCVNTIKPVKGKPNGSNGCATQANPEWGEIGSPWRQGHYDMHARRRVAKIILKDLWLAAA